MATTSTPYWFYPPTEVIQRSTTLPPRVLEIKYKLMDPSGVDADVINQEEVKLTFVYAEDEMANRSRSSHFIMQILDLESSNKQGYIQYANRYPYKYWQRAVEEEEDNFDDVLKPGHVNARLFITPVNDMGSGDKTSFIMPFKDLSIIGRLAMNSSPTMQVLAKFWHLFSKTPDTPVNRPKVMHIYLDVTEEDVFLDKELLSQPEYGFNSIGDWKITNSEMFRWIVQNNSVYKRINDENDVLDMTQEEKEFINYLLDSFNSYYRDYVFRKSLAEPFDEYGVPRLDEVFKIMVENPADHDDSIIIYVMKGKRWQL